MTTIPSTELTGSPPLEATNDTKRAAVFFTVGTPLKHVAREKYRDPAGKIRSRAWIVFETDLAGLAKLNQVYDMADADGRLDEFLKQSSEIPALSAFITQLQQYLVPAFIVWGRRFLENKQRLVEFINSDAPEFSVDVYGGPVMDKHGRQVGMQGFKINFHKK